MKTHTYIYTYLYICILKISYIEQNTFKGLSNLYNLDLSCNNIQYINKSSFDQMSKGLSNLHIINLNDNKKFLSLESDFFQGIHSMTKIILK